MNDAKYIGLDVHQATISVAVLDSRGNLVMEAILETKAETILQFIHGLRGSLHVTFEEGTWAAWLHDLLQPHVTRVLVCDPRKNALLKVGNKSDRIDARKLAELLYLNKLNPVYHGENGIRTLKELARSYLAIDARFDAGDESAESHLPKLGDSLRRQAGVRTALSCGMACEDRRSRRAPPGGTLLPAVRRLAALRQQVRRELLAEGRKHPAMRLLRQIPSIGPIRAALLIALMQTPHRFRTKRQLWAYCGLALKTYTSGEYRFVDGQLKRSKKVLAVRGLNRNHNHDLKNIFKGAATRAASTAGPFQDFYQACVARGMKPHMARLTLARKIAAITLLVWKKGVRFDAEHLKQQAA